MQVSSFSGKMASGFYSTSLFPWDSLPTGFFCSLVVAHAIADKMHFYNLQITLTFLDNFGASQYVVTYPKRAQYSPAISMPMPAFLQSTRLSLVGNPGHIRLLAKDYSHRRPFLFCPLVHW